MFFFIFGYNDLEKTPNTYENRQNFLLLGKRVLIQPPPNHDSLPLFNHLGNLHEQFGILGE